jgi:phosphohistidine phosphatase
MKLFFMRHGDAVDIAESDSARPLSDLGRTEVRQVAEGIANMGAQPTHIFASPRIRAQQTAQIVADVFGGSVVTQEALNYSFNVDALPDLIAGLAQSDAVWMVGHNPSISETVRAVCGANIAMKTGAVAYVKIFAPTVRGGELKWYVTPKVFRS